MNIVIIMIAMILASRNDFKHIYRYFPKKKKPLLSVDSSISTTYLFMYIYILTPTLSAPTLGFFSLPSCVRLPGYL